MASSLFSCELEQMSITIFYFYRIVNCVFTNSSLFETVPKSSFGHKYVPITLDKFNPCQIIAAS
jgi:hypothetical protein